MLTKLNLCPALGDPPFVSATRGLELLEHKLHEGASASAGTLVCMRYSISDSTLATAACHSPLRLHGTRLTPRDPFSPATDPHTLSLSLQGAVKQPRYYDRQVHTAWTTSEKLARQTYCPTTADESSLLSCS